MAVPYAAEAAEPYAAAVAASYAVAVAAPYAVAGGPCAAAAQPSEGAGPCAVAQPFAGVRSGVVAQRVEFEAECQVSVWPAGAALEALQPVWVAEPRLAFAPFPA